MVSVLLKALLDRLPRGESDELHLRYVNRVPHLPQNLVSRE